MRSPFGRSVRSVGRLFCSVSNASICYPRIENMASNNSRLELGDSVHEALLSPDASNPSQQYERETQAALRRKEQQLDANSHRRKLFGWLSYAFARYVS